MERSRLNLVLGTVTGVAIAVAAWMSIANWNLVHALEGAQAAGSALEINALAMSERISVAERAKATTEHALAHLRAQLAEAEKAKEATELSVKQLQERLASSESARETAERSLKASNDQLAQLKATAKAKDELDRARTAGEAAEQALQASPPPRTSPQTPLQ